MRDYLATGREPSSLSVADLLAAREQFHVHLMQKANVIGTAIGKYRIRKSEPWPDRRGQMPARNGKAHGPRTLGNSEVRPYSLPAILVFIDEWHEQNEFNNAPGRLAFSDFVPPDVYLPNGDVVPICVIQAERDDTVHSGDGNYTFPSNYIGGGYPILADVQNGEHVATIGGLVTDGHTVYALTSQHVCGPEGEKIFSILNGNKTQVGISAPLQVSDVAFEEVYPEWPGKKNYVHLDAGLVKVDDLTRWTTQIYGIGQVGEVADLSSENISLRLIGCPVRAFGAASKLMQGEICALFYRYKTMGGFEYLADLLIGPRGNVPLGTHHGDSGALWVMEMEDQKLPRPIAVQWGGQLFMEGTTRKASSYALATCLSTVLNKLDVDFVRDWNLSLPEYWGAVGHYSIANLACDSLQNQNLKMLMKNNLTNITYDVNEINKKNMRGLSTRPFVPLADVADMVWKVGPYKRGGQNSPEHSNHFADMDRALDPPLDEGGTLLEICKNDPHANVTVPVWQRYYDEVHRQFPKQKESRGLLPFRVWQIYQEMVESARQGEVDKFVCAAGIVSHYIADACQPLHISYLFDGDPDQITDGVSEGKGVHSSYEEDMVDYHVQEIITGVTDRVRAAQPLPVITGGQGAAVAVVDLMQRTFAAIEPREIVEAFVAVEGEKPKARAMALWDTDVRGQTLGERTMDVMAAGCVTLAEIWESAWLEAQADTTITNLAEVAINSLTQLYQNPDFLPSKMLDTIGPLLEAPTEAPQPSAIPIQAAAVSPRTATGRKTITTRPEVVARQEPARMTNVGNGKRRHQDTKPSRSIRKKQLTRSIA
jgi:hypothetical protein